MSSGKSGLAVAIDGESHTGISEDGPEPPKIKCRWEPCCTILRIAGRTHKPATPRKKERDKLAGLCLVHQQMVLDYEAGLSHIRPPFYTEDDQRQEVTEAGTIIRRKPAKKSKPQEPDPSESP